MHVQIQVYVGVYITKCWCVQHECSWHRRHYLSPTHRTCVCMHGVPACLLIYIIQMYNLIRQMYLLVSRLMCNCGWMATRTSSCPPPFILVTNTTHALLLASPTVYICLRKHMRKACRLVSLLGLATAFSVCQDKQVHLAVCSLLCKHSSHHIEVRRACMHALLSTITGIGQTCF